ncbi:hypothetical protein NDU88_001138 [Pleurodeles waltl]|uniref:Uncharacterized protein n=1 Tax=Pleurodeles waltl TaxID=8319 RepID=A0AAV7RA47_PLEWA|nr:hypothetical protein NDU88_001138 [Pleurodeles waltl]
MAPPSAEAPGVTSAPPRGVDGDREGEGGEPQSGPGPEAMAQPLPAASSCTQAPSQCSPETHDRGCSARPAPSQAPRTFSLRRPSPGRRTNSDLRRSAKPGLRSPRRQYRSGGTLQDIYGEPESELTD